MNENYHFRLKYTRLFSKLDSKGNVFNSTWIAYYFICGSIHKLTLLCMYSRSSIHCILATLCITERCIMHEMANELNKYQNQLFGLLIILFVCNSIWDEIDSLCNGELMQKITNFPRERSIFSVYIRNQYYRPGIYS